MSTPGLYAATPPAELALQDSAKISASSSKNALLAAELVDKLPNEVSKLVVAGYQPFQFFLILVLILPLVQSNQ